MRMNTKSKYFVLLIFSMLFLFACKELDLTDPLETKPEMPPIASMQIDFSSFPENNTLAKITGKNSINNIEIHDNWAWAWIHGVAWKTLVSVGMSIPFAAFVESFNHEAVQQEDGRWLWEYSFSSHDSINHTASLYATIDIGGIDWEMYITKETFFDNFMWFSGRSDLFGKSGTWTFFTEPKNPEPWLGIEWEYNKSDSTGSIKYTDIHDKSDGKGGYINYGLVADSTYDAFFNIYDAKKDNLISIKWNRETHEGRVKDFKHFGDDEWYCWNSNLENIECN